VSQTQSTDVADLAEAFSERWRIIHFLDDITTTVDVNAHFSLRGPPAFALIRPLRLSSGATDSKLRASADRSSEIGIRPPTKDQLLAKMSCSSYAHFCHRQFSFYIGLPVRSSRPSALSHLWSNSPGQRGVLCFLIVALLLFVAAAVIRTTALTDFPTFIHNDESGAAVYLYSSFLEPGAPSPLWGFNGYGGHCNLGPWLGSLGAQITGENTLWSARLTSAVSGLLSILLCALALYPLYGPRVVVFFLATVTPFHLHVHFSRTGFTYIHAVLMSALVFWAYSNSLRRKTWLSFCLVGVALGFAVMAYSATHVLPAAIGVALLINFLSSDFKAQSGKGGIAVRALKVCLLIGAGVLIALGPQIVHVAHAGFPSSSRLHSQFILDTLLSPPTPGPDGQTASPLLLLWQQFERTVSFFYGRDGAVQYGAGRGLFERWTNILAIFGSLVLLFKSLRGDSFAVLLLSTGVFTVLGSMMMVEGSFSPHLIVFSILGPIGCAFGLDTLFRIVRLRSPWIIIPVIAALLWPWGVWNYEYIKEVDQRKFTVNTWIHHLPVNREGVLQVRNISKLYVDIRESMYPLMYPKAKFDSLPSADAAQQLRGLLESSTCPCLVIIDRERESEVEVYLNGASRSFEKLTEPRIPGAAYYIR
jgi:hypothetical protein